MTTMNKFNSKTCGFTNKPLELRFTASEDYANPFYDLELDVMIYDSDGEKWNIPAFWIGKREWGVRFRAPHEGTYTYISKCTVPDSGLHEKTGIIEITPYTGSNPLYLHGPIRISENGRYFVHEDQTPFAYFCDTWHPLLTSRINATDEVNLLAEDRAQKGFTVIEFINGFMCDLDLWDPRLSNEAGFAWETDLSSINPEYYNISEPKINAITERGMALCIYGSWGSYMKQIGTEKMKKHFRNMIARWAAYPVFWAVAGETCGKEYVNLLTNPGDSTHRAPDDWYTEEKAREMWTELLLYLKETDPFHNPISTHGLPGALATDELNCPEYIDFNMFQAAHHTEDYEIISEDIKRLTQKGWHYIPAKPVVCQECCYEGMLNQNAPKVQRWIFWHSILRGCAGTTYGANGIFNASHKDQPFGIPVYLLNWGDYSWQEAYQFEGCQEVSLSRKYLNKYDWWRLQPAPDKIINPENIDSWQERVAAEIPNELLIGYYQPVVTMATILSSSYWGIHFCNLTPGDSYEMLTYDPIRNIEKTFGKGTVNEEGILIMPSPDAVHDYVYIARKVD